MSAQDNNYFAVLLEEIRAQNKAVLEYVGEIPKLAARLESIEQNVVCLLYTSDAADE